MGTFIKKVLGVKDPQVIQAPAAPTPTPAAAAAPEVAQVQASKATDGAPSTEAVARAGKRGLTIRRTAVGAGSGLNV